MDMTTTEPDTPKLTITDKDINNIGTFQIKYAMPQIEDCTDTTQLEGMTTYLKDLSEKALITLESGTSHEQITPRKLTELLLTSSRARERLMELKFDLLKKELLKHNNIPTTTDANETVKNKKRRTNTQQPTINIPTSNRFQNLTDESDQIIMDDSPSEKEIPASAGKKKWIPPITIENVKNPQELIEKINEKTTETIHAQMKGKDLKVFPPTIETHREIQSFVTKNNLGSHTYELPEDRELKVVIRGLSVEQSIPDILEDLKSKDLPVKFINVMQNRVTKKPMPLFLVTLEKNQKAKDIYNVEYIGYLRAIIQPLNRRNRAAQCYRCQLFHHSSRFCTRTPRCLKCAENHLTQTCIKPKTTPAKCCNCGGPHPANYSGCPKNPDNLTAKRPSNTNFWEERAKLNQLNNSEDSLRRSPLPNPNPPDVINQLTSQFDMRKFQLICDGFHTFCEKMSTSKNIIETAVHAITILKNITTAWNVQDTQ